MIKTLQNIKEPKKIIFAVVFVAAFAIPVGVQAHSQNQETPTPVVTDQELSDDEKPTVILVQQTEEEETPLEQNEPTTPKQPPVEVVEGSAVAQALAVAEAEHPGSTVVAFSAKKYNDINAYKFYFADGWKVIVNASDGSILKSYGDKSGKNKHPNWKKGIYRHWNKHHDSRHQKD